METQANPNRTPRRGRGIAAASPAVGLVALYLAATAASGCATVPSGFGHEEAYGGPEEVDVTLRVNNDYPQAVNIYGVVAGSPNRLGRVSALGDATFDLPASVAGASQIRFLAVPVPDRGREHLLEPVSVHGNNEVVLTVHQRLALSTVRVR